MKHQVPVEKGKTYELQIHTLGTSGEGVGRTRTLSRARLSAPPLTTSRNPTPAAMSSRF